MATSGEFSLCSDSRSRAHYVLHEACIGITGREPCQPASDTDEPFVQVPHDRSWLPSSCRGGPQIHIVRLSRTGALRTTIRSGGEWCCGLGLVFNTSHTNFTSSYNPHTMLSNFPSLIVYCSPSITHTPLVPDG